MNATLPPTVHSPSKLLNGIYARLTLLELAVDGMANDHVDPASQYYKVIREELAQTIAELTQVIKTLNAFD